MNKRVCNECNWRGTKKEILFAPNPFKPDENISGCPNCKEINSLFIACDELDCWERATCGTPTNKKYRITCGKHLPKNGI